MGDRGLDHGLNVRTANISSPVFSIDRPRWKSSIHVLFGHRKLDFTTWEINPAIRELVGPLASELTQE